MTIVAVGVTVILSTFGQAAWLDGKIERQGTNLAARSNGWQTGWTSK